MGSRYALVLVRDDKTPAQVVGCFKTEKDACQYADCALHLKRKQYIVVPYIGAAEVGSWR